MLAAIGRAQRINRLLGGALVAPWNVDELDEGWLEAFRGLAEDFPGMQAGQKKVEEIFERRAREHPTYRK